MAGCKGSEDDSERERGGGEEEEEDRGEEAAWVEAMACGGRQKGMLLSFVSRAYFGAFRLSWRDPFRGRREREGKDRRRLVRGCERRRKKFGGGGGGTEEKELTLAEGDEGGLDGIRGMSCNNRAAIRASVPTRGGATARLSSARLGSLPFLRVSSSTRD